MGTRSGVVLGAALWLVATPSHAQLPATAPPPSTPTPAPAPGRPAAPPAAPPGTTTPVAPPAAAPGVTPAALPAEPPEPTGPQLGLVEAVRATLRQHPAIALARAAAAASSATLLGAGAPFDPVLNASLGHAREQAHLLANERPDPAARSLTTDTTTLSVGASAGFRWGMTLIPSLSLERLKQQLDPSPVGATLDAVQRARADLTLLQPLLRGRGEAGAASGVLAAERALLAAEHTTAHAAQAQVFTTIAAYYRLVAGHSDLARLRESLARSRQLLAETKLLVEAEQRPRADMRQVEASLANQTRGLLEAESNLIRARYELALAMGLDGRLVPDWQPADGFPATAELRLEPAAAQQSALAARRDLAAAGEHVASAAALVSGADRNALPALDLGVSVGYSGVLGEDGVAPFFRAAGSNVAGVNAGATLSLELPIENDAAQGELQLRRAELHSNEISRDDLARQVRANVGSALADVRLTADALTAAEQAVALLKQAVEDERDKLREGLSTVIDVVLTEERLTQAELTRTSHELRYSLALARLRFELGALPSAVSTVGASADAILSAEAPNARR